MLSLLLIQPGLEQQVSKADNAVQRGAQLMAHGGQEVGFGVTGMVRRCAGLIGGFLGSSELHGLMLSSVQLRDEGRRKRNEEQACKCPKPQNAPPSVPNRGEDLFDGSADPNHKG